MNIIQRIAKNTFALYLAEIICSILSIVISIAIARQLGDVDFGKYSFAFFFVAFFTNFSDLGYTTLSIREISRDKNKAKKYIGNTLSLRTLLSIIIFIIIVILINVMNYPTDTKIAVYLFGIGMLAVALSGVFTVSFRVFEKMEYESVLSILFQIMRVILSFIVLFLGYGIIGLALVYVYSGIIILILRLLLCEIKFVKIKMEFDFVFIKNTIITALPFTLVSLFSFIYIRIDTIMLSVMQGDAVVGWYNAATSLTYGLKAVPHLFMSALLPVMSYYFITKKDSLKLIYEKSFNYLLILGVPITIGTTLLSDKIILFLYGSQYFNSIIVLQILAWDILFIFLYTCLAFLLMSIDKQHQMAVLAGCSALLNVVLNLFLIPSLSYIGASFATLLAEGFLLVCYLYLAHRFFYRLPIKKIIIKPILSCCIMGFFVYTFHHLNLFVLIIMGCFIYFGIFYLIKGFSHEDIDILKSVVKRNIKNK